MLIYRKYIISSVISPLLTLLFILTSIVWITQTIKLLYLLDKGIQLSHFFSLIILIIPSLLFTIMPIVSVLGIIYTYNKLSEERQIIILRSSGLNNFAIAKPALLIAFILVLFSYYLSFYLMPLSYNKLKKELDIFRETYITKIVEAKTFNQLSKYITLYVEKKNSDSEFSGMILFDNTIPQNKTTLYAKNGELILEYNKYPIFKLYNGVRHSYDTQGHITKLYFEDLIFELQNSTDKISNRTKSSLELYIDEMLWPDKNLSKDRQRRLITEGHQRIIWPMYNYIFVFLALSIFLAQPYNRKAQLRQIWFTLLPVIILACFHFSIQKLAYEDNKFILFCYLNAFIGIIFSIWQSNRKTL